MVTLEPILRATAGFCSRILKFRGGACRRSRAMTVPRGAGDAPVRVEQSRISSCKNQSMRRGTTERPGS